ncbi:MAG: cbb3-type cytochrome oxidase maturation protein [Motiliproteus sp.]|jgi:cbb3-type cytochrome oxidase maturation protein
MEVIYGLIPGMILMGLAGVAVFFWAAKSGQFDDMEGEGSRILMDDDLEDEAPLSHSDEEPGKQEGVADTDSSAGAPSPAER